MEGRLVSRPELLRTEFIDPLFIGSQAVLLLGEPLPAHSSDIPVDVMESITRRSPLVCPDINQAVREDSNQYWHGDRSRYRNFSYNDCLREWTQVTNTYLSQFAHRPEGQFLAKIGVDVTRDGASKLRELFSTGGQADSAKFVALITGNFSAAEITANKSLLEGLANIFSTDTGPVVNMLVNGVKNAETNLEQFVEQARAQSHSLASLPGYQLIRRFIRTVSTPRVAAPTTPAPPVSTSPDLDDDEEHLPSFLRGQRRRAPMPPAPVAASPSADELIDPGSITVERALDLSAPRASTTPLVPATPPADELSLDSDDDSSLETLQRLGVVAPRRSAPVAPPAPPVTVADEPSLDSTTPPPPPVARYIPGRQPAGDPVPEPGSDYSIDLERPETMIADIRSNIERGGPGIYLFRTSPEALLVLLKGMKDIGQMIKKLTVEARHRPGDHGLDKIIYVTGDIGEWRGGVKFSGLQISGDGRGGLRVENPAVLEYYRLGSQRKGLIDNILNNLNQEIRRYINEQVGGQSGVVSFTIVGDKLVLKIESD